MTPDVPRRFGAVEPRRTPARAEVPLHSLDGLRVDAKLNAILFPVLPPRRRAKRVDTIRTSSIFSPQPSRELLVTQPTRERQRLHLLGYIANGRVPH